MTISPEAKEANSTPRTDYIASVLSDGDYEHPHAVRFCDLARILERELSSATQSAKNSAANFRKSEVKRIEAEREVTKLQKEIERLRGEVEKAFVEGWELRSGVTGGLPKLPWMHSNYERSRAKRVAEGKE